MNRVIENIISGFVALDRQKLRKGDEAEWHQFAIRQANAKYMLEQTTNNTSHWEGILLADGQRITYPIDDVRGHHITSVDCWCRPFIDNDGNNEVLVHQSADKREEHERGKPYQ